MLHVKLWPYTGIILIYFAWYCFAFIDFLCWS